MTKTLLALCLLAASLVASAPLAHAADPATHGAPPTHAPAGEHSAVGGEEASGHHDPTAFYLGDTDADGTPNWRDPSPEGIPRDWKVIFDADDPYVVPELAFHAFNLFLVIALLYRFGARPIGDALKNRALAIRKQLTDAHRLRDEAQARNEELAVRLTRFEREVEELHSNAAVTAKADAEALVARAHEEAERIAETAQRNIAEELRRAKAGLRKEAVGLAVELAQSTLSREVQSDDHRRLARQFLDSLNADSGDHAHG